MRGSSGLVLSIAMLATSGPSLAATVEIVVRERGGAPIRELAVRLEEENRYGAWPKWHSTDAQGRVEIPNVAPGTYSVWLGAIEDRNLVRPENNPWAPAPTKRISAADERVSFVVEVWRGAPVRARWLAEPETRSSASIVLTSEGGGSLRIETRSGEWSTKVLPPGRWVASLEAPEGYVLEDLGVDGASIFGATAPLELAEDAPSREVTFTLAASCRIDGRVEIVGRPGKWILAASLVEPGTWQQATRERGSPIPQHVEAHFVDEEHYEIHLPTGRWRIEASGEGLVASEPPFVEVGLAPGDARRIDFSLRFGEDDPSTLRVRVLGPDGEPLRDAHVEARAIDEGGQLAPNPPMATADPIAVFRGLSPGRYLIVAAHPDFVEATEPVSIGKESEIKRGLVLVMLHAGASLRIHATRPNGEPVAGVRFEAIHDGPLDTQLADPDYVRRKQRAVSRTEADGIAEIRGLYPGGYQVTGSFDEPADAAAIVTIGAPTAESETVTLVGEERRTLEATVRPASGLVGRLRCDDGVLPAPSTSIRVVPARDARDAWDDPQLGGNAVAAKDGLPLRGSTSDRFIVGPIPPGSYKVAIRPTGVEAWSWIGGTLGARDATIVHVEPGTTEDLGMVSAECGPVIVLVPSVASGEAAPELDPQRIQFEARGPEGKKGPGERLLARTETLGTAAVVVGLPEGDVSMQTRIGHRYLSPTVVEVRTTTKGLTRGQLVRLDHRFERLGGCLEVQAAEGKAIRVHDDPKQPSRSEVKDRLAVLEGLNSGRYVVDLCADLGCARILRTWPDVEIVAGRSTYLP